MEKSFKGLKLVYSLKKKSKRSKKLSKIKKLQKRSTLIRPPMDLAGQWELISDLSRELSLSPLLAKRMHKTIASRLEVMRWLKITLKKEGCISPLGRKSIIPPKWLKDLAKPLGKSSILNQEEKWGFEDLTELISAHVSVPTSTV